MSYTFTLARVSLARIYFYHHSNSICPVQNNEHACTEAKSILFSKDKELQPARSTAQEPQPCHGSRFLPQDPAAGARRRKPLPGCITAAGVQL